MAGRRSRTAVRSVATATMPIPAAASSSIARLAGTGGENLSISWFARPSRNTRWWSEPGVGSTPNAEYRDANTRLR